MSINRGGVQGESYWYGESEGREESTDRGVREVSQREEGMNEDTRQE